MSKWVLLETLSRSEGPLALRVPSKGLKGPFLGLSGPSLGPRRPSFVLSGPFLGLKRPSLGVRGPSMFKRTIKLGLKGKDPPSKKVQDIPEWGCKKICRFYRASLCIFSQKCYLTWEKSKF